LDKKEGYEFAETLLRRGKEEVAVALGVDGDDYEYSEVVEPVESRPAEKSKEVNGTQMGQ
jgi:hypothetical protein